MKKIILGLCQQALQGKLNLNDFYDQWPKEANNIELLSEVYEDLEDSIQHMPGKFFTKEVDLAAWEKSNMYMYLYLDSKLLERTENYDVLYNVRAKILKNKKQMMSKYSVDKEIDRLLSIASENT